jgi:hypothetical protein
LSGIRIFPVQVTQGFELRGRTVLTKKGLTKGNFRGSFQVCSKKTDQGRLPHMHYVPVEKRLQAWFSQVLPLSSAQCGRIAVLCSAIGLAGEVQLTKIARFLKGHTQPDSRVRWLQRLLQARFVSQERVYQPVLRQALAARACPRHRHLSWGQ